MTTGPVGVWLDEQRTFVRVVVASGAALAIALGSPLTPANILDRATTQSCAGCHQLSNGKNVGGFVWPSSLGFVHIDENRVLSPALIGTFIPHRKQILEDCICGITC